jgi:hypothetical protein
VVNVFVCDAEVTQFLLAGQSQGIGNPCVKPGLHNANAEFFPVHARIAGIYAAFVCAKHGGIFLSEV